MEQIRNHQLDELIDQNAELIEQNRQVIRLLKRIAREDAPPVLTRIKLAFKGASPMATAVAGPVILTTLGQQVIASLLGFDQFGNPFLGPMPPASFTSDDTAEAIVEFDPTTGLTTAVANGVANITGSVQTTDANGNAVTLQDTEAVTVAIPVVPPPSPILSSIKVAFAPPAAAGSTTGAIAAGKASRAAEAAPAKGKEEAQAK